MQQPWVSVSLWRLAELAERSDGPACPTAWAAWSEVVVARFDTMRARGCQGEDAPRQVAEALRQVVGVVPEGIMPNVDLAAALAELEGKP